MPTGEMDAALARIQNDLFDLGADLCRPDMARDHEAGYVPLRMLAAQVERLEAEIDAMNARLEPLRSFILPGGTALSAHLHLCRTVCRRAERLTVELATMEEVNAEAVKYLNRLSDWFFVAGRIANNDGKDDVLWVPGLTRPSLKTRRLDVVPRRFWPVFRRPKRVDPVPRACAPPRRL